MRKHRRWILGAATMLPFASTARAQPRFPPPVPDIPTSHVAGNTDAARNADVIRRQNELINAGRIAEAVQFLAPDTLNHGVAVGRSGVLRVLTDILATFPDWASQEYDLMATDDEVVVRYVNTGTHKGTGRIPVNGGLLVGVPPTGKRFKVQSIHWYTLKDGLITEHRASRDDIGMMQQLGLLPMSPRYDLPKAS